MAATRSWTPFPTGSALGVPHPGETHNSFVEPASPELLWREFDLEASYADRGRKLFTGTLAQRNRLWREFRSYLRQAKEYGDAATYVRGPSAALLLYYMALNLAKAEL